MAIIIYSLTNCPKCAAAKAVLKRNSVPFEEKNIEEGEENRKELASKLEEKGMPEDEVNMPVLDIGGNLLEGFDKEKMLATLKEKGFLKESP